eukprot:2977666-Pyramimonas_sp.AAC.1
MSAGITAAFPGYDAQRDTNYTNAAPEAMRDAHALDCRIRSANGLFGTLHEWAQGWGHEVSETVMQNCTRIQDAV